MSERYIFGYSTSAMQLGKMQLQGNFVFMLQKNIIEREYEKKVQLVAGVFAASEMTVVVEPMYTAK